MIPIHVCGALDMCWALCWRLGTWRCVKTKVVQVLEELACQWDGVDRTTMGTRTLYVDQREGR